MDHPQAPPGSELAFGFTEFDSNSTDRAAARNSWLNLPLARQGLTLRELLSEVGIEFAHQPDRGQASLPICP